MTFYSWNRLGRATNWRRKTKKGSRRAETRTSPCPSFFCARFLSRFEASNKSSRLWNNFIFQIPINAACSTDVFIKNPIKVTSNMKKSWTILLIKYSHSGGINHWLLWSSKLKLVCYFYVQLLENLIQNALIIVGRHEHVCQRYCFLHSESFTRQVR